MLQHLWSLMVLICVSRHQTNLVHRVIATHWYTYQVDCVQRVIFSSRWAQMEYYVTNAVVKWSVLKMVELITVQGLLSAVAVPLTTQNLNVLQVMCSLIPCKFENWTISIKRILLFLYPGREGGGGEGVRVPQWGGAAWPLKLWPSLFKTKIVRFMIPCLRHLAQNYTLFKTKW